MSDMIINRGTDLVEDYTNNRPHTVIVRSDELGRDTHEYNTLDEALAGLCRLTIAGLAQNDGIERTYEVIASCGDDERDEEDAEEATYRVEYDISFWSGDSSAIGTFVDIKPDAKETVEHAFRRITGIDCVHVIHYEVKMTMHTLDCPVGHGEYHSEFVDAECPSCADGVPAVPNPQNNRVPFYQDTLDADAQVSVEEMIAATIFDECRTDEETAQALSQQILLNVLAVFRKDIVGYHIVAIE